MHQDNSIFQILTLKREIDISGRCEKVFNQYHGIVKICSLYSMQNSSAD